jgi:hypothetical protein
VGGLGPAVAGAIAVIEHELLYSGQVAREFRRWQVLADCGQYRALDNCGVPECCGPEPRELLETVIRRLPAHARPAFRVAVQRIDAQYVSKTVPDCSAPPDERWWERRMPRHRQPPPLSKWAGLG